MNRKLFLIIFYFFIVTLIGDNSKKIKFNFTINSHKHLTFKNIESTKYSISPLLIKCSVKKSASALIFPFLKVKKIKSISFKFRTTIKKDTFIKLAKGINHKDSALLVGIILKSDKKTSLPFFSPDWTKKLVKVLNFSPENIILLKIWSDHKENESWVSSHSNKLSYISPRITKNNNDDFFLASRKFGDLKKVIGIWIMADGDDIGISFNTEISDLSLELGE